ncbi:MAG: GyrI-like domain-containing protein [Chloroflexota bacterium]|nr:GyrI-like domain-containing protein [Chloroflexota bacterium]
MSYLCEITSQPAQPTLSVRTRAAVQDLPATMGRCFGEIVTYVTTLGGQLVGPAYAAHFNMDMADLDAEIGFGLAGPLPGQGEIAATWLPGGQVASTVHEGPYDGVGPAYEALTAYVQAQGRQPTGVAYEYYLNDSSQLNEPPRTRVVVPLVAQAA